MKLCTCVNITRLISVSLLLGTLTITSSAQTTTVADLVGTWDMVHDDWVGTLQIYPSDQKNNAIGFPCSYSSYVIGGTWTDSNGVQRPVRGHFQGFDRNRRTGELCPKSNTIVNFTIDFGDGSSPQPFEGYLFTHQKHRLAGYTWWQGMAFGWFAIKR